MRDNWDEIGNFDVDPEYPDSADATASVYGMVAEVNAQPDEPIRPKNTSGIDPVSGN